MWAASGYGLSSQVRSHKEMKAGLAPACITLCFLTVDTCTMLGLLCLPFRKGLNSGTGSQIKPFFPQVPLVICLVSDARAVANTLGVVYLWNPNTQETDELEASLGHSAGGPCLMEENV